ncbi:MAG: hypothetical protein A2504_16700 [Bdellovibrionales bacterium RIFOXYD12_FULL_39_22]|nr:MAG: hypothetical protein A2385_14555 [Bdellovibrionales bacterium RIFOXYB1_FULL_39_21]OFZ45010.1 MAG: hypothetical protein A2485_13980 [Bdellovibrionales bacterium RIFOXYC12_FULL_39_17]OFZ49448.1 MAG: hypothetical protein A2404_08465 [Bdellovibrionales bacterium RIFOXYC1_FULL_39_130]OFZ68483.1 MAG: hypothetical protein A2451_06835 [Bdellovibrionales bacterium RIFOXYC2_FULL_39_8]OFZ77187.1 MAG: hypothetical protein A2560_07990 [Bdellovibrionales bacterium RIFOXYD1_FULL_39_84]OFZ95632.1 MAG:
MSLEIKIDGIYDEKTFNHLAAMGILNFGFDFRPLSFNFIPQHKFQELINSKFSSKRRFFLHFADEKDFMIWKIVDDLTKLYVRLKDLQEKGIEYLTMQSNFFLEFSYLKNNLDFYNQFNLPFYLYVDDTNEGVISDLEKFHRPSHLKGIILNYNSLMHRYDNGTVEDIKKGLLPLLSTKRGRTQIEIVLDVDWDAEIFTSLLEIFPFQRVAFKINPKIEFSYRNVDINRVENHLKNFSQML